MVVIGSFIKAKLTDIVEIHVEFHCQDAHLPSEQQAHTWIAHSTSPGKDAQSSSIGVFSFVWPIFAYFSLLVAAFNPCQGRLPLKKYEIHAQALPSHLDEIVLKNHRRDFQPASRDSSTPPLLLLPLPRCVLILIYLAVPDRLFFSLYGICCFVLDPGTVWPFRNRQCVRDLRLLCLFGQ